MDLNQLLNSMKQPETPSSEQVVASAHAQQKLASALDNTSSPDAVETLLKTAEILADNEKTAEEVHARQCGRAFADAALEVFSQVDAASKVASYGGNADSTLEAAAAQGYNDTMQKVAAEKGYNDTMQKVAATGGQDMQKVAAEKGYNDTMQKVAAEKGYNDTMQKVAAEKGYNDTMQKVAAEKGYNDTMQKVAAEYSQGYDQGLQDVTRGAAEEFMKGASEAQIIINALQGRQ